MKTDINFINGIVFSAHKNLITQDKLMRMADAHDAQEVFSLLRESGYATESLSPRDYSVLLTNEEHKLLDFIREAQASDEVNAFCLAENDFHNADCAVRSCHGFAAEDAFRPDGQFPRQAFIDYANGEKTTLCKAITDAMDEAEQAFSESEPTGRALSTIFLRAYYKYLLKKVRAKRLKEAVRLSIDAKNCSTALRCGNVKEAEQMWIEGGRITRDELKMLCQKDERAAMLKFAFTKQYEYIRIAVEEAAAGLPMKGFEKVADEYALGLYDDARYEFSGTTPIIMYYLYKKTEIKNVRTVMSLKLMGCPPEEIKSRLRKGYVG